jgi:23S rRNA pseudouridine1911/1915/1917 synthase
MTITVPESNSGDRLDRFLAEALNISRNQIQKAIADSQVKVNGQVAKVSHRIQLDDEIEILSEISPPGEIPPLVPRPDIELDIVYQDEDLAVISKPSGMLMHPALAKDDNTLAHALITKFPGIIAVGESPLRPGIMQRLDRDASGLVVVALNEKSYQNLKQQFQKHEILKEYDALVQGKITKDEGTIDLPIGRAADGGKMSAHTHPQEGDRSAVTHFHVDERPGKTTRLTVRTETGRTHQIRVHFKAIGHPLVGDYLYGKKGSPNQVQADRLFLHAKKLGFHHPADGRWVEFTAPLPQELEEILDRLR